MTLESTNVEIIVEFDSLEEMQEVFGNLDANLRQIEKQTGVYIVSKENTAVISGEFDKCAIAQKVLEELRKLYQQRDYIDESKISYLLDVAGDGEDVISMDAIALFIPRETR